MTKMGRPKSEKPKEIRYSIRLDVPTEAALQAYCKKRGLQRSQAIRNAVLKMVEEGNKE